MPELTTNVKDVVERKGLKDGGHVILRCKSCNKPLVDVWRTRPYEKDPRTDKIFEWKLIAKCCYCDSESYITTVLGVFHIGGYGVNKSEELMYERTSVINSEPMENDPNVIVIYTEKAPAGI